jgi:hypothetical protein
MPAAPILGAVVTATGQAAQAHRAGQAATGADPIVGSDTSRRGHGGSAAVTIRHPVAIATLPQPSGIPGTCTTLPPSTAPVDTHRHPATGLARSDGSSVAGPR